MWVATETPIRHNDDKLAALAERIRRSGVLRS
jgi:hypothetical protein